MSVADFEKMMENFEMMIKAFDLIPTITLIICAYLNFRKLDLKEFYYISIGAFFNFIFVFLALDKGLHTGLYSSFNLHLSPFLDVLSSYFFFRAGRYYAYKSQDTGRLNLMYRWIGKYQALFIFFAIGAFNMWVNLQVVSLPNHELYNLIGSSLSTLLSIFSLLCIIPFIKQLNQRTGGQAILMQIGIYICVFDQLVFYADLLSFNRTIFILNHTLTLAPIIRDIAFFLGFLSKVFISIGVVMVYFSFTNLLSNRFLFYEEVANILGFIFHEINTPLSGLSREIDHLKTKPNSISAEEMLNAKTRMREYLDRTFHIINSNSYLLRENHDNSSSQNLIAKLFSSNVKAVIDVETLIEKAIINLTLIKVGSRKQIYTRYSGNLRIFCNEFEIIEALVNIIKNALKAPGNSERMIIVETKAIKKDKEELVTISIFDNGEGIRKKLLPHLFEVGMTTSGSSKHGYGLVAAKRYINSNKGAIEILSPIPKGKKGFSPDFAGGTLVCITFPRVFN